VLLCLKAETEKAFETLCLFKNSDSGQVPKKTTVSINFSHGVIFLGIFLKMGLIGCPKTSVKSYHSVLHNIPEEPRPCMTWQCSPWFGSAWSSSE
jgi:hypothetical protein